ncbi:MAG TPA: hypothetical protein VFU23_12825 [Gemmatimonadales bacterium]|nr:hypothetical protein [Gemmatimonadales bacterium]
MPSRLCVLAAVIVCAPAPGLRAQSFALQGLAAHSTHSLVGSLLGGEAVFRIPLDRELVSLQIGVAYLAGSSSRFETTCHGFIQQPSCEPEPVSGNARLTNGSLELGVRLWGPSYAALRILGGLRLAEVHASWRGLSTNRDFAGDRTWWGVDLGLEGTLAPWRRLPVGLQLSGGLTRMRAFQSFFVADAYTPLDVSSTLATVRVGLVWRPRP